MLFDGEGKPFPVIYCDGETETNLGIFKVLPTMNIRTILFILSEKTKISPHQFSVFLAEQNNDWKIPLTAKVDFSAVASDGAAYYFYVKRRPKNKNKSLSEKRIVQRRDGGDDRRKVDGGRQKFSPAPSVVEYAEMEKRMMNLRKEREAFLKSMGNNAENFRREMTNVNGGGNGGKTVYGGGSGGKTVYGGGSGGKSDKGGWSSGKSVCGGGGSGVKSVGCHGIWFNDGIWFNGGGSGGKSVNGGGSALCRECMLAKAKWTADDFHLCIHDEVIVGFRPSAGPISRPVRNSGENSH